MTVSVRSYLTVGVAALAAGAVAVAPVHAPAPQSISTAAAVRLSAAVQPLIAPVTAAASVLGQASVQTAPAAPAAASAGNAIINAYNAIEPWVQWGFEVGAWAVGYVPYAGYFGSQINIAYNTGEPLVQSWVYSFAYLIDGNVALIGLTLVNGVKQSVTNLVQGEIQWILGYLPPLPPIPPFAAVPAGPAAAANALAAAVTTPTVSPRTVNPPMLCGPGSSPRSRMPWLRSPMPSRIRRRRLPTQLTSKPIRRTRARRTRPRPTPPPLALKR